MDPILVHSSNAILDDLKSHRRDGWVTVISMRQGTAVPLCTVPFVSVLSLLDRICKILLDYCRVSYDTSEKYCLDAPDTMRLQVIYRCS